MVEREVDKSGPDNAAQSRHERVHCLFYRIEVAARQEALGYLHCGNSEEKDHENIVRQEVKAYGAKEGVMKKMPVAFRLIVGPDESCCHTRKKGDGKFTKKINSFFHRFIITVLSLLISIDVFVYYH